MTWWRATQIIALSEVKVNCRITSNGRTFKLPIYGFIGLVDDRLSTRQAKKKKEKKTNLLKHVWQQITEKLEQPAVKNISS